MRRWSAGVSIDNISTSCVFFLFDATSYFGLMENKTSDIFTRSDITMDIRLIPEFDGVSCDVIEWLEKFELICNLRGIEERQHVLPLRLTGGAFAVYMQLSAESKKDYGKLRESLISAFSSDKFFAYEDFVNRKLGTGESVDVYLADLRRLAALFGRTTNSTMICAFVAGLPDATKNVLRAGSRLEAMDLDQVLERTRAVLVVDPTQSAAVALPQPTNAKSQIMRYPKSSATTVTCHKCGKPNHFARNCLLKNEQPEIRKQSVSRQFERGGPYNSRQSGNGVGEVDSAPLLSPFHRQ